MIDYLICKRKPETTLLIQIIGLGLLLLAFRLKITKDYFFLFLAWNVLLAIIPLGISMYLCFLKRPSKTVFWIFFCMWLLCVPNAPYLITDFIHIKRVQGAIIWLDIAMVFSFSVAGFLLYYYSIKDMRSLASRYFSRTWVRSIFLSIPFLCGFGVYLGRFERWNSWSVLTHPYPLLKNMMHCVTEPQMHVFTWVFTLGFGLLLIIAERIFEKIFQIRTS